VPIYLAHTLTSIIRSKKMACHLIKQVTKLFGMSQDDSTCLCLSVAGALGVKGALLRDDASAARAVRSVIRRKDFMAAIKSGKSLTELVELVKPPTSTHKVSYPILKPSAVKISRVGLGKGAHAVIYS